MCESPPAVFPVCGQCVCVYTRENLSFHHVSAAGEPLSVELFDQRTHQSINSMLVVEGLARLTLSYALHSPHIVRGAIVTCIMCCLQVCTGGAEPRRQEEEEEDEE